MSTQRLVWLQQRQKDWSDMKELGWGFVDHVKAFLFSLHPKAIRNNPRVFSMGLSGGIMGSGSCYDVRIVLE